jgi:hypothetical protein
MDLDFNNYLSIFGIVVAIIVPTILFFLQRNQTKKSLIYQIIYEQEVLSRSLQTINESIGEIKKNDIIEVDSFEVKINGKTISNLWIVEILFLNNGFKHIDKSDFESPVAIQLPEDTRVISASGFLIKPTKEIIKLSLEEHSIIVEPLLLNSTDSFAVKMILNNHKSNSININGRICGITKIKNNSIIGRRYLLPFLIFTSISILVFISYIGFEIYSGIISGEIKFQNLFKQNPHQKTSMSKTESIISLLIIIYYFLLTFLMFKAGNEQNRIRKIINEMSDT